MFAGELSPRVVITGMGIIGPMGLTVPESWDRLIAGESRIQKIDYPPSKVAVAGKIQDYDTKMFVQLFPDVDIRRQSEASQYALLSAHQALLQADLLNSHGVIKSEIDKTRIGAIFGTGIGGGLYLKQVAERLAKDRMSPPSLGLKVFPDRVSSGIAMNWELQGPTFTTIAACASGNIATAVCIQQIQTGQADIMLAGGTEGDVDAMTLAIFDPMNALTKEKEPSEASRPFDEDRGGFVAAEGAGALVIESYNHARARGVKPIAEIVGYSITNDGGKNLDTDPTGIGAYRAMIIAFIGLPSLIGPGDPFFINAHATGTPVGDIKEAEAINKAVEELLPHAGDIFIYGPKGAEGHPLGASGAMELIYTVMTVTTGTIPPNHNLKKRIPELKGLITPTTRTDVKNLKVGASNSFGFGGHNATLVVKQFEE